MKCDYNLLIWHFYLTLNMNLAIDAGNTFIKAGFFESGKLVKKLVLNPSEKLDFLEENYQPKHVIFSSVSKEPSEAFTARFKNILLLTYKTPVPVSNVYETPETLGMDRLAEVVGAKVLFPADACLVIAAGTAITYDFIDAANNYYGGGISPGISMRFKALHTFTQKLPLVEQQESFELIGRTTHDAIRSGVLNGVLAEAEGIINRYKTLNPELKTIICGGDVSFFESKIKEPIFAVSDLALIGLNRILEYNVSGN